MSGSDGTPEPTRPDRTPGRRRAAPEKPGRATGSVPAPTHARPAARPASRPPGPSTVPVLPPSDRPAARPARRVGEPPTYPRSGEDLIDPLAIASSAISPVAHPPGRRVASPVSRSVPTPAAEPGVKVAAAPAVEPEVAPAPEPEPAPSRRRLEPRSRGANRSRTRTPRTAATAAATRSATSKPAAAKPAPQRQPATRTRDWTPPTFGERDGWVAVLVLGALGVAVARFGPDLPDLVRHVSAILVSGSLAWGLAVRTGGRMVWAAGLSVLLATTAVATEWQPLMAGAAVGTGVVAATLAVMLTTPAATFTLAIREVLIATAFAWLGALGVVGYAPEDNPDVDVDRFGYVVFGLALAGTIALVYRLGAGLHGLGRRGYVVAGGAVMMLVVTLAYSEAIAQWGSRDLVGMVDDLRDGTRATFGAVPHPIVALLGYPALVWGVFMRARRRQGWWVCAFGVAATAPAASRLVAADLDASSIALGGLYSLVIGLALGYLVIRVEQSFTGTHGRRARRDEEAEAHRPEPRRTQPLR